MGTQKETKINHLLQIWPKGIIATDEWLKKNGISKDLKHRYLKSQWITSVGRGAVKRSGDIINWSGGLWALQNCLNIPIVIGGKTSIEFHGASHFINFREDRISLYTSNKYKLPLWFNNIEDVSKIMLVNSNMLPEDLGIELITLNGLEFKISSLERAILELLYLVPNKQNYEEAKLIMENLIALRPSIVQSLLENCRSIKVKRLFLYMAETLAHPWFKRLNLQKINLGKGKRVIVKHGNLDRKYLITIPK